MAILCDGWLRYFALFGSSFCLSITFASDSWGYELLQNVVLQYHLHTFGRVFHGIICFLIFFFIFITSF